MWSDILHSPPAVAAIFAAILAFVSGVAGPYVQYRIGKRQAAAAQRAADAAMLTAQNAGTREIATMRLAWMDKLRDTVAQFHSILMIREDVDQAKSAEELSLLGTQLDLLLNREDKHARLHGRLSRLAISATQNHYIHFERVTKGYRDVPISVRRQAVSSSMGVYRDKAP
jgi:hypothetical protein